MTTTFPAATLQVEPHAIPGIRAALDSALNRLTPHLQTMAQEAYIRDPWLGDPDSARLAAFYNDHVMNGPDGPFHALLAYQDQLQRIRDQRAAAEADYRRVEGDNSDLWGRA